MAAHNEIGQQGEDLACGYLEAKGYQIWDRNYRVEKAEIDIIAFNGTELHFVEVKTRSNTSLNAPEESITKKKKDDLAKAGSFYLFERQLLNFPAVFDVIAIGMDNPEHPMIKHIEDAFRPGKSIF